MNGRQRAFVAAGAAAVVAALGCDDGGAARSPSWQADIAPLVTQSCLPCHGAEAAFDFSTRAAVVAQRDVMLAAMASGLMPPAGVDRSGNCGDYRGARPIDDEDIAAFASWAATDLCDELGPTTLTTDDGQLARRDVDGELSLRNVNAKEVDGEGWWIPRETAADRDDQHRCFLAGGVADASLVGFEVVAAAHLHHAMIFAVDNPAGATRRDAADAGRGWDCDGPTGVDDTTLVATWTPGAGRVWMPPATGLPLTARLILQLHSNGAAVGDEDDSVVRVFFSRAAQQHLAYVPVNVTGFLLPPGVSEVRVAETNTLENDLVVFGVLPHMHRAGRALALRDGDECLAAVPQYDFGWQETAWLRRPLSLAAGTALDVSCVFDTSDRVGSTHFGEGSADEMCAVFLLAR